MKRIASLFLVLALISALFVFLNTQNKEGEGGGGLATLPEVLDISQTEVTVAWSSHIAVKGRLHIAESGTQSPGLTVEEKTGKALLHEITIDGLKPGTRYSYRIEGSERSFQFQTEPDQTTPFSFLYISGGDAAEISGYFLSELPEFIVGLPAEDPTVLDPYKELRPFLGIHTPQGVDSPYLRTLGREQSLANHALDWGGLRLIFLHNTEDLRTLFNAPGTHTLGVFMPDALYNDPQAFEAFHEAAAAYNVKHPSRRLAFVSIIDGSTGDFAKDDIRYIAFPGPDDAKHAVRLEVDVDAVRAVFLGSGREVMLKEPPLKRKITCAECRRLADKGSYEASVKAYTRFVAENQGHYQIDDAYFAVAEIYDTKLFLFQDALTWYNRLVTEYPEGTLTPPAQVRIGRLKAYADHDFEPLKRFERIRKVDYAAAGNDHEALLAVVEDVQEVIADYPAAKITPVMLHWTANQYSSLDVDKAVSSYRGLIDRYADHELAVDAYLAVAETYYSAGRYTEAAAAYDVAAEAVPSKAQVAAKGRSRAERNLLRIDLARGSVAVLGGVLLVLLLMKPRGLSRRGLPTSFAAFTLLTLCLGFGAWLINEQFYSMAEMLRLVVLFPAAAALSGYIGALWLRKLSAARQTNPSVLVSLLPAAGIGLLFFASCAYLIIYSVNIHYLIIAGL
jgi:tetratricopeptide (TPR) repeat protein